MRLGGLQEKWQVDFESGIPWFPGDFPGTEAGRSWEAFETSRRTKEWDRRPKGKRIEWSSVPLGKGRKGEVGDGCACDWATLASGAALATKAPAPEGQQHKEKTLYQLPSAIAAQSLSMGPAAAILPPLDANSALATVRITLLSRGVPSPCARIYRLPNDEDEDAPETPHKQSLRAQWLALDPYLPRSQSKTKQDKRIHDPRKGKANPTATTSLEQRLAADLVKVPGSEAPTNDGATHPEVPTERHLVGFVTTGEFCLAEGKGVAIGSVLVGRMMDSGRWQKEGRGRAGSDGERRLCIVRNAGETIGRLAEWVVV